MFRIGDQLDEVIALHGEKDQTEEQVRERSIQLLEMVGIANSAGVYKNFPHDCLLYTSEFWAMIQKDLGDAWEHYMAYTLSLIHILNTMPQAKKDELVVQLINKNRDKLLQKGRALAAKNGVRLQLCDVAAKKI